MITILILMFFCHIIDDFCLQTKFSFLKQKSWWEKTCKDEGLSMEKYGNDYKMALFEHSLEWSIAIMLPIIFMLSTNGWAIFTCVIINTILHYIIDNAKANQLRLNLIQDQLLHFIQIIVTFFAIV